MIRVRKIALRGENGFFYHDTNSSRADLLEAVTVLADVVRTSRRVFGLHHPSFAEYREELESASMRLADDESRAADAY